MFTRAKPPGWATNDTLTAAEINYLDIDHANALDKTGDTIDGGSIEVNAGGEIILNTAAAIQAEAAGAIEGNIATAIRATAAGGITSTVAGGIRPGVAGGIKAQLAGGIQSDIAAGIKSAVVGGIQLAGGATDWTTFSANRTRTLCHRIRPLVIPSGWGTSGIILTGPGTSTGIYFDIEDLHDGATLSTITCHFAVTSSHVGIPSSLPQFYAYRKSLANGLSVSADVTLAASVPAVLPTPASTAAYVNSNLTQSWSMTCNQYNVIDRSQYLYYILLQDENGTNALSGSSYFLGFSFAYTAIADMRFG